MPSGPWKFGTFEYLRQILDDTARRIVVMKSSQKGFTETEMIRCFWAIERGQNVMYLFGTSQVANDWSAGRFDVARKLSDHLRDLFPEVSNVGHKVAANYSNMYVRGSNSPVALESVPIDLLVIDEFDRMHRGVGGSESKEFDSVALAQGRLLASVSPHEVDIGTPTLPGWGISEAWENSSRHQWWIHCPRCKRNELLTWPGSVQWEPMKPETAQYVCAQCGGNFSREEMLASGGEWIAEEPFHHTHGYRISGLYSPRLPLSEIVKCYEDAEGNPGRLQVFYNNFLGEPYSPVDSGLTQEMLQEAITRGSCGRMPSGYSVVCMGIDVGTMLDYTVAVFEPDDMRIELAIGRVRNMADIKHIMAQYNVKCVVIDANPERRKAREFVDGLNGNGWMCFYTGQRGELKTQEDDRTVAVDRTEFLDAYFSRYYKGNISVSCQVPPEYYSHHLSLRRGIIRDEARYVTLGNRPDHLAHAGVYCEIAGRLSARTWGAAWV